MPGSSTDSVADEIEAEELESEKQRARDAKNADARTGRSPGRVAYDRLKKDKVAIVCLVVIIFFIMLAIFGLSLLLTLVFVGYIGLGFIVIWWVVDALLLAGMVHRYNNHLIDRIAR